MSMIHLLFYLLRGNTDLVGWRAKQTIYIAIEKDTIFLFYGFVQNDGTCVFSFSPASKLPELVHSQGIISGKVKTIQLSMSVMTILAQDSSWKSQSLTKQVLWNFRRCRWISALKKGIVYTLAVLQFVWNAHGRELLQLNLMGCVYVSLQETYVLFFDNFRVQGWGPFLRPTFLDSFWFRIFSTLPKTRF